MPAVQIWRELSLAQVSVIGWSARRIATVATAGLLLAIRKPDDVPALLIEVPTRAVPPIVEFPSAEGFQVVPEPILPGPTGRTRLCLVLANERYRDVFGVLVDNITAELATRSDEEAVVREFLARLRAWQIFMRRHGPTPLDVEAQIGLAAELLFLRSQVVSALPGQAAVTAWIGPLGSPQDFVFPCVAIEVKGTGGPRVQISSFNQLDTGACGKPILLCCVDLVAVSSGLTLIQIISDLRNTLSRDPSILRLFDERLLEVGYLEAHQKYYEGRQYRVNGMVFYTVTGLFPRIERNELREGVISGSYIIDVSACQSFRLEAAEVDRLIREARGD